MKAVISSYISSIVLVLITSCSVSRPTYNSIAEQWANSLYKYVENPTSGNQAKLKSICSEYTSALVKNEQWLDVFCLKLNGTKFKYQFVKDSISNDKMRAYVWYGNENSVLDGRVMKITLRQSLTGWVVDMPLM